MEQSNDVAVEQIRPKRKSKPKRHFSDTEARQVIEKCYQLDDDEYNLDDESTIKIIEGRDKLLAKAFDMECEQRNYVVFADAEVSSIVDVISNSPNPIIIYDTDLEPLDQLLTAFVNTPGGCLSDYLIPEFDDVKEMLEYIREKGDCPLYDKFVPTTDTDEFDDYVLKILQNMREKIQLHRSINFLQTYDEQTVKDINNVQSKIEPVDDFTEKLATMKSEGEIVKEEEPAQDVDDLDDVKSETPSEDCIELFNTLPTTSKEISDIEREIIELDNEADPSSDIPSVDKENKMDYNSDNESCAFAEAAVCSKHSDDCIAVGESAITPIASPTSNEGEIKAKDDDDVICID